MKILNASFSSTFYEAYLVIRANGFLHRPSYLINFTAVIKTII